MPLEPKTQHLEQQRSWYLSNLGIVQYIERSAAVVEDAVSYCELPKAAEKTISERAKAPVIDPVQAPEPARKPAAQPAEEQPGEACNFRLACWHIPGSLLVLDSLEPGRYPEPARLQMITRLLQALKKLPGELPPAETIDWPPGPAMPGSWLEARQMMAAYLEARQTRTAYSWALVMGEAAANAVQEHKPYAELLGQQLSLPGGAKAIVVRGMTEMLRQPATKKETWEAIRFLVTT